MNTPTTADYTTQVVDPKWLLDSKVLEDNSIRRADYLTVLPESRTALTGSNGTIRLHVNNMDTYFDINDSHLRVELKIDLGTDGAGEVVESDYTVDGQRLTLAHNGFWHLFSQIRLEVAGQEVETMHNPFYNITMMQNATSTVEDAARGLDSGFATDSVRLTGTAPPLGDDTSIKYSDELADGNNAADSQGWLDRLSYFYKHPAGSANSGRVFLYIPLDRVVGFARDHKRVMYGSSLTLTMTRADLTTSSRLATQTQASAVALVPRVQIKQLEWNIRTLQPSLEIENKLNRMILDKATYPIVYRRARSMIETVPAGNHFRSSLPSLSPRNERPLYLLLTFQRRRRTTLGGADGNDQNASMFDDPGVRDIAVYLNSQRTPVEIKDYDFNAGRFYDAYDNFQRFKHDFLGLPQGSRSPFGIEEYKHFSPIHVINLQDAMPDSLTSSQINMSIDVSFNRETNDTDQAFNAHIMVITRDTLIAKSNGRAYQLVQQ